MVADVRLSPVVTQQHHAHSIDLLLRGEQCKCPCACGFKEYKIKHNEYEKELDEHWSAQRSVTFNNQLDISPPHPSHLEMKCQVDY